MRDLANVLGCSILIIQGPGAPMKDEGIVSCLKHTPKQALVQELEATSPSTPLGLAEC